MRSSRIPVLKLVLGLGMFAAAFCSAGVIAEEGRAVVWPTQGWQTSTPEEQGVDSAALAALLELGSRNDFDSLLIVRHGKIVLDAYYAPYTADLPHVVNSVTKAVIGTLTSMALQDGLLKGTDQRMLAFFGERSAANLDDNKKAITLQSLLDMTSGLARDGRAGVNRSLESTAGMERSRDWIQYILDRPMAASPGDGFNYDSGNAHLLSAILAKVTGMSAEDYAKAKLFGPLGITAWKWRRDPQGISTGGYGLALHPRDMAKFGYLYLHNGTWEGKPLVSPAWIDGVSHATVDMKLSFAPEFRYSNFFWARPDRNVYWASGLHCQLVMVYPVLDLVAVTTGRDNCPVTDIVEAIPKAVRSETAIQPDPAGTERLASVVRAISTEAQVEVKEAPPIASAVSGKTYTFSPNPLGVKSLSLTFVDSHPHYDFEIYSRDPTRGAEKISGPLGLDGRYRRGTPTAFGIIAVKGRWLDEHAFEIERRTLGEDGRPRTWTLSFDGDKVSLRGKNFEGVDVAIDGKSGG
ncbi:serine hydrolase [Tardiphaga sp. OK245]|uniref:serine hydrolase domain-containing protein n=1 Tax=Tardiphaga sp. OK245 TaxID=1855306 RepID=UPI0008A7D83C|nr:serine hydrolase [Tardiphaga sp. OK245]SEI14265.1 CubicO group peptidase, beta-lactamase class C family [Tardiphaga sp. OK245]